MMLKLSHSGLVFINRRPGSEHVTKGGVGVGGGGGVGGGRGKRGAGMLRKVGRVRC